MATAIIRAGAAGLACALLAGCLSFGGKVPPQLFSLTARQPAPAGAMTGGALTEALVVLDPEAERRLDVQRVPVQIDESNVAYLKDAQWVERPARLFRRLLAETLRARGKLVVESPDAELGGRTVLSGRLVDMGYDARSGSVVIRYDALRTIPGGAVMARRFEAVVPGVAAKASAVGPALNQAANEVAAQVAEWVG